MKQKLFGIFLVLILCIGLLPMTASAAVVDSGGWGEISWKLDDRGTLTISGTGEMDRDGDASWSYDSNIKKVVIEPGVTSISSFAFRSCKNLTSVTIPDTVTHIDTHAFYGCSGLTAIDLPDSLVFLDECAFAGMDALTSVTVPQGITEIPYKAFSDCDNLKTVVFPENLKTIGEAAFSNCDVLNGVVLPAGMKTLEKKAFFNCDGLTQITIPGGIREIGEGAFQDCDSLKQVFLSDGVREVGVSAFRSCDALTEVSLPDTLTTLHNYAFYNCANLKKVIIPGSAREINDQALNRTEEVIFLGNPPFFTGDDVYGSLSQYATAYYPAGNEKWTEAAKKALGYETNKASTTWVEYDPDVLSIAAQPVMAKVKAGTTAQFRIVATGTGLTYQWQYRISNTGTWKNTSAEGCRTDTLKVSATGAKNLYQYRCCITDANGKRVTSKAVTMYVLNVKTHPKTAKVKAGDTATFTVAATGHNKTYQWQYRTSSQGEWANTLAEGNKTATLKVDATAAKNLRQFRCRITDSAGNVTYSNAATLYVLNIKIQPKSVTAAVGTNAEFTVTATGHNKTYQWQYRDSASGTWKNTTAAGNKTAALTVPVTAYKNGRQFRCVIKDSAGNVVYSAAATLTVK